MTINNTNRSNLNSSTTPLLAGGVFTGGVQSSNKVTSVSVNIYTDVSSANNGLSIQFGPDGVNWYYKNVFNIVAETPFTKSIHVMDRFIRVIYTNGSVNQTIFSLTTIFQSNDRTSIQDVNIVDSKSIYGELVTVERTPVIALTSIFGLSNIRNITALTGTGEINDSFVTGTGEFELKTLATNDVAQLYSAGRGDYQAGFTANCGIGVRSPTTITGEQELIWGIGDDPYTANTNGAFFGVNSTGVFVAVRRNGVTNRIYQPDWNQDTVDGNGKSGLTLDITRGNIFNVDFSWYGYGLITFVIYIQNSERESTSTRTLVHTFRPEGETSLVNPNLPILASVKNGATNTTASLFIAGRQYSVIGRVVHNNRRITSERTGAVAVGATLIPLVSFRKKTAYINAECLIEGMDVNSTEDIFIEVRVNGTLTGASFGTPTGAIVTETAIESDTSATAITGGVILWMGMVQGGTGNRTNFRSVESIDTPLIQTQSVSICALQVSTGSSVRMVGRILERW